MNETEITTAAQTIFDGLTDEERDYARSESQKRTAAGDTECNTPFSCLHDLMDANELLPEESIQWDAFNWEGAEEPDFSDANKIIDAINALFEGVEVLPHA